MRQLAFFYLRATRNLKYSSEIERTRRKNTCDRVCRLFSLKFHTNWNAGDASLREQFINLIFLLQREASQNEMDGGGRGIEERERDGNWEIIGKKKGILIFLDH